LAGVEHEHVVAAQFLGTHVFPMLRHIHLEAILVSEQDEPAIDLRRFGMAIVAGVGIHEHLQSGAFGRGCCVFMAVGDAGE